MVNSKSIPRASVIVQFAIYLVVLQKFCVLCDSPFICTNTRARSFDCREQSFT